MESININKIRGPFPFFFRALESKKRSQINCYIIDQLLCYSQNRIKQYNRIRDFNSFVDEAAPGFELGKKDLQSPALPLGHAAKTIHNRRKNSPPFFQFIVLAYCIPFLILFLNLEKLEKKPFIPLLIVFDLRLRLIVQYLKTHNAEKLPRTFLLKNKMQIFTQKSQNL